ncbi:hypothetical protein SEA_PHARAOH_60 [Mycobacterium phage Pharaoh]|uniref:Minor tail protein n=1 Tax=Mycobacterium phage Pharaoh TaxID=2530140 RepID=A0A481W3E7_9CAUD|nr:hypothetical protein KIV59_gp30 [Mycobacterium phage Pharaoh]QBJ00248.1 hypothetical protein SEA_PHARAOH_60 [Mycobacterium phage Pharaoh]
MTAYIANAITVFGSMFAAFVIARYSPGKRGPQGFVGPRGYQGPKGDQGEPGVSGVVIVQ